MQIPGASENCLFCIFITFEFLLRFHCSACLHIVIIYATNNQPALCICRTLLLTNQSFYVFINHTPTVIKCLFQGRTSSAPQPSIIITESKDNQRWNFFPYYPLYLWKAGMVHAAGCTSCWEENIQAAEGVIHRSACISAASRHN